VDATTAALEPIARASTRRPGVLSRRLLADVVSQAWSASITTGSGPRCRCSHLVGIVSVVVLLAYGNGFRTALDSGFAGHSPTARP